MVSIEERILKDIEIFNTNIGEIDKEKIDTKQKKIVELAEMYAKDSKSFFDKKDYYTSFSAIAYAHGLLDSIRKLNGKA
jgi:uncharacterized protein